MFNVRNFNKMIANGVFDFSFSNKKEITDTICHLNNLISKFNNTATKNGHYEIYQRDFKIEVFSVNSYKDFKEIKVYIDTNSEIEVMLQNGKSYIISEYSDYYFDYGVTAL